MKTSANQKKTQSPLDTNNVVAVRRSLDEASDRDAFETLPVYYTAAGGNPRAASALASRRKTLTEQTLTHFGVDKKQSDVLDPVWPPVSVFALPGPRRDVYDPTTRTRLASIRNATWSHVDAALSRVHSAQARWRSLPGKVRVAIVLEVNEAIKTNAAELANLTTLEIGKVPSEATGEIVEVHEVAEAIAERVGECGGDEAYPTRVYPSRDPRRKARGWLGEERALPLGVIGKITAFNFPYAPFAWGALPALAAGNGVIWKPHPSAVLTGMSLTRVCEAVLARHGFSGLVTGKATPTTSRAPACYFRIVTVV